MGALNLLVSWSLKDTFVLCGTNNLLLDSIEDIVGGILEIARLFKATYSYVNVAICRILPRDNGWSVSQDFIKEVNQFLKLKCYESFYKFVGYDSGWTFENGSVNADFYYSDRLHLVEKEIWNWLSQYLIWSFQWHHL